MSSLFSIKDYPFQNGNKRIAITALPVLLHKNKKWIRADNQELFNLTSAHRSTYHGRQRDEAKSLPRTFILPAQQKRKLLSIYSPALH
ncbi:MAG: hypothetical protein JXE07_02985 [Candidatus Aminicenantes bacterium]|nr:hypothetical protein [Candidatus Aminicenantes bacterium]